MFSTHEMKYIWFKLKEVHVIFILYFLKATCNVSPTEKGGAENAKPIKVKQPQITYMYQNICHVLAKKCIPTLDVFVHK